MQNSYTIEIDRPAAHVWSILSDNFAHLGDWATAVPSSRPDDSGEGRICETPFRGFGEVKEVLLEHDEAAMTYTYTASSVPRWLGVPKNSWFVKALGEDRCQAGFKPDIETTPLGKIAFRLSGLKLEELADGVLNDLKHFAETGEPSPSKQASLA
jgi:hypothetical protein